MSDIQFHSSSISVRAGLLANPIELPLVCVDNADPTFNFVQCVAKNGALTRLLVDDRFLESFASKDIALRSSNILRTLKELKDAEWNKHVDGIDKPKWKQGRHTVSGVRPKVVAFPTRIDITAP